MTPSKPSRPTTSSARREPDTPPCHVTFARAAGRVVLLLGLAAALRIPALTRVPPGLNQDEACNAWNAWCLLKTGRDQTGARWPLYYLTGLGENRCAIQVYFIMPFQLVGGLNVWTTRLPFAAAGVLTVFLLYWTVARLFDPASGLAAGALLAVSPWHVTLTRLGFEAALAPFFVVAVMAALVGSGLLPSKQTPGPRPIYALLTGLIAGLACYGYAAGRILVPALLCALAVANLGVLRTLAREVRGRASLLAFAVGFATTFGPLAWQHVVRPHELVRRAEDIWLWERQDAFSTRLAKVTGRYVAHFGYDFLFHRGDRYEMQNARGFGMYGWHVLPLLIAGLAVTLPRARSSVAARALLLWALLYPIGDSLHRHAAEDDRGNLVPSLHMLRSSPGLPAVAALAGVGAVAGYRFLARRVRQLARGVFVLLILAAGLETVRFGLYFVRDHPRQPNVAIDFHADLMQALAWLRPRAESYDAVFFTTTAMNMPYGLVLVGLQYDPHQWFRDEKEFRPGAGWDLCYRFGRYYFLYDESVSEQLGALARNGRPDRVGLIVRPDEAPPAPPTLLIRDPMGAPSLVVYELEI